MSSKNTPAEAKIVYHMTPGGYKKLQNELYTLLHKERPKIVEIVSWAAGNGDRSENGDYIYNKKKLREIDRRVRYLTKRLENSLVVDPLQQQNLTRIYFGAKVTYIKQDDTKVNVMLVGEDETDYDKGKINWHSPVGRALMKAQVGDVVKVHTENGIEEIEVLDISYPLDES